MSELDEFPLPWRVSYTSRHKGRGWNQHILAANDNYVAERVTNEAVAQHIVEAINKYDALNTRKGSSASESPDQVSAVALIAVDKHLSEFEKIAAVISAASITVGVAGDKLAQQQAPESAPILDAILSVLNDLSAIAYWLVEHAPDDSEVQP